MCVSVHICVCLCACQVTEYMCLSLFKHLSTVFTQTQLFQRSKIHKFPLANYSYPVNFATGHRVLWQCWADCLFGLVVKASTSSAEDPGFKFCLRRDFVGVESYQ